MFERLGSLQFDPLDIAGRNHDLVLLARIARLPTRAGPTSSCTRSAALFEAYNKGLSLLPTAELPWYRVSWDRARARARRRTPSATTPPLVEELLDRIRETGPLSSTDVEPRAAIDWYWRPTNQVRAILEALAEAGHPRPRPARRQPARLRPGRAALPGRRSSPSVRPQRDQFRHKLLSRYRAHGLLGTVGAGRAVARARAQLAVRHAGRPAARRRARRSSSPSWSRRARSCRSTVEGVRGTRYVVRRRSSALLARPSARSRPVDARRRGAGRRVPRRRSTRSSGIASFLRSLYDFDYVWEVYVPAAKRRWGYYVLPILFGDRLVGRIEPRIDRRAGALRVIGRLVGGRLRPARGSRASSTAFVGGARGASPGSVDVDAGRLAADGAASALVASPGARLIGLGGPARRAESSVEVERLDPTFQATPVAGPVAGRTRNS